MASTLAAASGPTYVPSTMARSLASALNAWPPKTSCGCGGAPCLQRLRYPAQLGAPIPDAGPTARQRPGDAAPQSPPGPRAGKFGPR